MNNWNQNNRNDERREDKPPYSRIFIVCGKDLREDDLRTPFEQFGKIEDIYMPRDRNTRDSKGVAYIKFTKTSEAAAAIEAMHLKTIGNSNRPIKVMVATKKSDAKSEGKDEPNNRLFIKVLKQDTEADIEQYFSKFGDVESVHIQKVKHTDESKGLAYVQFKTFTEAALAFEECDKKYRPVFASPIPKHDLKRSRDSFDFHNDSYHSSISSFHSDHFSDYCNNSRDEMYRKDPILPLVRSKPQAQPFTSVCATCSPAVPQKHIERLFNIVPGMVQCYYSNDVFNGYCKALVTYEDQRAAAYAVERLNNFEYPSGEIVGVKPDNPLVKAASDLSTIVNSFKNAVDAGSPDLGQLADAIAQASSLIKAATTRIDPNTEPVKHGRDYCDVALPPPQPMANATARVVQRCFIVCKPQPPPNNVLRDVFRRFGDLIDISTFPNKTFGFAKYASAKAAQEAINTLHGATVCGVKLKVLEADEKPSKDEKVLDVDSDSDQFLDPKRMRILDRTD